MAVLSRASGIRVLAALATVAALGTGVWAVSTQGGALPGPLPLFPPDNWWNLDISAAPVDPASASYINFIGTTRRAHPDFGGDVSPGSAENYGFPYAVVDSTLPLRTRAVSVFRRERRRQSHDQSELPLLPDP
jgi:hypothetical protein